MRRSSTGDDRAYFEAAAAQWARAALRSVAVRALIDAGVEPEECHVVAVADAIDDRVEVGVDRSATGESNPWPGG